MRHSRIEKSYPATRDWLGTDAKVVRHVRVCGEGQLAVATRVELERLGIQRDSDYLLPSLRPDLVIACADSETDQSFSEAARRAVESGSPLLFGCLLGRILRLGPLIDPCAELLTIEPAAAPADCACPAPRNAELAAADADLPLTLYARLGALLICVQALNFLLDARNPGVRDRAVELNPWSMESKSYRVLKVRQ